MYFRRVPPLVYLQPLLGEIIDDEGTEVRAATVPRGSRQNMFARVLSLRRKGLKN